jgi:hypothetical protein
MIVESNIIVLCCAVYEGVSVGVTMVWWTLWVTLFYHHETLTTPAVSLSPGSVNVTVLHSASMEKTSATVTNITYTVLVPYKYYIIIGLLELLLH